MYQRVIRDPGGSSLVRVISNENVVNGSILLVPADTEAFFVCNGFVSNPYPPGRYEIHTGVDPFFVRFRNIMTGGDPGITCQVFYVNKFRENCEQGGTGNMVFLERRFNISMNAKAAYTMRYTISNPRIFLSKLVGMHNHAFGNEDIQPAIVSMILPAIKEAVINSLSSSTVHNIQNNLTNIGAEVQSRLTGDMLTYGISLKAIVIVAINIAESDMKRLNELEDKAARGRLTTDLEVDNIERVYGNVNNRTMTELLTGSVRGPAKPVAGRQGVTGMVGAITALPWQIEMAKMAMNQMTTSESVTGSQQQANAPDFKNKKTPPDLPKRPKVCPGCNKLLELTDAFCKYCGHKL